MRISPLCKSNKIKILSFVFVMSFCLSVFAQPNEPEFSGALEIILDDRASFSSVLEAMSTLQRANQNTYDLGLFLTNKSEFRSHGDSPYRTLVLVGWVGKSAIREAVEILFRRIRNRPLSEARFSQWTRADVEALTEIASKQDEKFAQSVRTRIVRLLLSKIQDQDKETALKGVVESFVLLKSKSPSVLDVYLAALALKDSEAKSLAAFGIVEMSVAAILKCWNLNLASTEKTAIEQKLLILYHLNFSPFLKDKRIIELLNDAKETSDPRLKKKAEDLLRLIEISLWTEGVLGGLSKSKKHDFERSPGVTSKSIRSEIPLDLSVVRKGLDGCSERLKPNKPSP